MALISKKKNNLKTFLSFFLILTPVIFPQKILYKIFEVNPTKFNCKKHATKLLTNILALRCLNVNVVAPGCIVTRDKKIIAKMQFMQNVFEQNLH